MRRLSGWIKFQTQIWHTSFLLTLLSSKTTGNFKQVWAKWTGRGSRGPGLTSISVEEGRTDFIGIQVVSTTCICLKVDPVLLACSWSATTVGRDRSQLCQHSDQISNESFTELDEVSSHIGPMGRRGLPSRRRKPVKVRRQGLQGSSRALGCGSVEGL